MSKAPICNCGDQMKQKMNPLTRSKFYGCPNWPNGCDETAPLDDED